MSQVVGVTYKSRIPSLSDDASIEEALRVYHYGVDNYSTQPIPDDSVEGNFRSLSTRITTLEDTVSTSLLDYLLKVSQTADPNIITTESASTTPLTIKGVASQVEPLQKWQNSSSTNVASITAGGSFLISGYASIGSTTASPTIALRLSILNASHKGLTIKSYAGQTSNIQEWQGPSGNAISWVNKDGKIYSNGSEVQTVSPFLLMGS